ncbi:hypothetical protein [Spirillospora sp. CA-294931]|uniref:hypothetical protein n=1 Tax=Spirillospora sp. CA-294931 TaxID=3240042 RepID=UPI003D8DCF89
MRWSLFSTGWITLLVAVAAFGGLALSGAGTGLVLLWGAWAPFPLIIGQARTSASERAGNTVGVGT